MKSIRKYRLNDLEHTKSSEDREEYEKDYARLIQSPAFEECKGSRKCLEQALAIIIVRA